MSARARALASLLLLAACSPGDTSSTGTETTSSTSAASTTDAATDPTTGAVPTGPECQQDSDCLLVNNCCECDPRPVDAEVAPCEGNCLQSTCDALQIGDAEVACRSGICEFATVACSDGPVGCGAPKPTCPEGKSVAVVADCWACVHPRYCAANQCAGDSCGDGWTCVASQSGPTRCAPLPYECQGAPSCACFAPYFDEVCGGSCSDAPDAVLCEDGG